MPKVTYYRPNRTLPRPFSISDVARIYCRLVDNGIPEEIIDAAIDERCGEERRRQREVKAAAQQAVAEATEGGTSIEDVYLQFLENAAQQILANAEYLSDQVSQLERTRRTLKLLAPAGVLLRRFVIGAPFAAALRLITRNVDGQLAQMLPLRAANEEVFEAISIFVSRQRLARALRQAVL